jgi:hypothetical protein
MDTVLRAGELKGGDGDVAMTDAAGRSTAVPMDDLSNATDRPRDAVDIERLLRSMGMDRRTRLCCRMCVSLLRCAVLCGVLYLQE